MTTMAADTETGPLIHFCIYFAKVTAPDDSPTRTLVHIDLHIPTAHIAHYSNKPVAWLRFVGFAITGCDYSVNARIDLDSDEDEDVPVPTDATALERHCYSFGRRDTAEAMDMSRFVNLANVEPRGEMSTSSASSGKIDSRDRLEPSTSVRDGHDHCVFTATPVAQIHHIIPHEVKNKRRQALARARDLTFEKGNIDSITNVITLSVILHGLLDRHKMVILATDDRFLEDEDVDPPAEETKPPFIQPLWEKMVRPTDRSFILQHLPARNAEEEFAFTVSSHIGAPHNTRARFASVDEPDTLPCKEALHYIYGAMMLRRYLDDSEGKLAWLTDQSEEERVPYDDEISDRRRGGSRSRGHDDVFEAIWEALQASRAADREMIQNAVEQRKREENHQKVTRWRTVCREA